MSVSIIDIAKLAGVSKSTVSAVINNHPSVRPATRERVLEAIKSLDYHPNFAARELCTSTPMNIGIIMPSYSENQISSDKKYFGSIDEGSNLELVSQLIEQISKTKYGVLVEHVLINDNEPALPSFALSKRVSGVFQISPLLSSDYTQKLRQYVPNVIEIGSLNLECDCVYTDFASIAEQSVDYLVAAGHKKIAFINCASESRTSSARLDGFHLGLKKHNLSFKTCWNANSSFSGIGGYNAFSTIWNSCEQKPTAVICATSAIAGGALRYMLEQGISVPQDVSIICNGDGLISEFVYPRLSAICRDKEEIAQKAFSLMMERLSNPSAPFKSIKTENHLVKRDSVKHIL